MREEFVGKTIYFWGDSITNHGFYLYDMRAYFQTQEEKCFCFNRGLGGNRTVTAQHMLDTEFGKENPDYAIICLGVNDIGTWLYDTDKIAQTAAEREKRDKEYFDGLRVIVDGLLQRGITPILCSPFAVNERIVEKENIQTILDNREKLSSTSPISYTQEKYRNMGDGLARYAKGVEEMAKAQGLLFFDVFDATRKLCFEKEGLFNDDGVHYSRFGHSQLAKMFLGFFGCSSLPDVFETTAINDEIFQMERIERAIHALPWMHYNPYFGVFTQEEIEACAHRCLADEKTSQTLRFQCQCYLERRNDVEKLREQIRQLTYSM